MSIASDAGSPPEVSELARALGQAARLAPSVHNTQPWRFAPLPDGLAIHEDPTRGLASLDPHGRLRVISCGAAVTNAALAVAHSGFVPVVELLPAGEPTLLARVRAGVRLAPDAGDLRLYGAIPVRRAHRRLHHRVGVGAGDVRQVCAAVSRAGARPVVPDAPARRRLGALLRAAVEHQLADPGHLAEVSQWVRHVGGTSTSDGVPVGSLGTTPFPADSIVHDGWDLDELERAPIEDELEASSVLGIATPGDARRDWLVAGVALQRAWLQATALDLAVTFADQATQWDGTRQLAADALGAPGQLQVVLRIGRPLVDVPPTPRRELADLWRWPDQT